MDCQMPCPIEPMAIKTTMQAAANFGNVIPFNSIPQSKYGQGNIPIRAHFTRMVIIVWVRLGLSKKTRNDALPIFEAMVAVTKIM